MSHPLARQLASPDPAERRAGCEAAAGDPAGALLADLLAEALGDADASVARAAADALAEIARRGGIPDALRAALRGDDPGRRIHAAFVFAELEPPGHRTLPALVDGLSHPEGGVRWRAARLLVETGRVHGEVLGMLLGLVRDPERPAARRMAAFCVRQLAPDLPEAARALVTASHDPDPHVRRAALTAMSALMDPPAEVRTRLAAARDADPDDTARRLAERALAVLDGSQAALR